MGKEPIFLNFMVLVCIFSLKETSNVHFSVSLMIYIRGTIDRGAIDRANNAPRSLPHLVHALG